MPDSRQCRRCGTCCEKGGPVLHQGDRPFLKKGHVGMEQLQVIRKGERAFNPFSAKVEPAPLEMIKIAVSGDTWECPFHQKTGEMSGCQIHAHRPLECRTLKCWDTKGIESILFKDCLSRFDLIAENNPIHAMIVQHEQECDYALLWQKVEAVKTGATPSCAGVQSILARDLAIRQELVERFKLSLQQELFYLGQPMFRALRDTAFKVTFRQDVMSVRYVVEAEG